jgi:alcohol dehydrogenase class IV
VTEDGCCHPNGVGSVRATLQDIQALLGVDDATQARERIEELMTAIGCPTRLGNVGVQTDADVEILVQNVNTERLQNNPRMLSQDALRHLLNNIR